MNCAELQTWILDTETPEQPPPGVVEHLRACGHCRQLQTHLLKFEQQLAAAPLLPMPSQLRSSLMSQIAETPQALPVGRVAPVQVTPVSPMVAIRPFRGGRRRFPLEHVLGYTMAAVASIMLGMGIGYRISEQLRPPQVIVQVAPPAAAPMPEVEPPATSEARPTPPEIVDSSPLPTIDLAEETTEPATPVEPRVVAPPAIANTPPPTVPQPATTARLLNDDELLRTLIQEHTETALAKTPQERLAQVSDLADLLWGQIVKEAEPSAASTGNLEWLDDTLAAIVETDLPAIARQLPAKDADQAAAMASRWEERSREAERLAVNADYKAPEAFVQLAKASQEGSRRMVSKGPLGKRRESDANGLMPLVAEQTASLAREDHPVDRAECSTALAEGLAQEIMVTALRGDQKQAGRLGEHFGRVLEQGVAVNLQRVDKEKISYQQTRRYQQVLARAQQSVIMLNQSFEAAPPEARKALEAALVSGGIVTAQQRHASGARRTWRWMPGYIRVYVVPVPR